MSHHLGRVVSDLSHSNSRGARCQQGVRHQSTAATSDTGGGGGNVGIKAKQKLALLFSGVVAWSRSESSAAAEASSSSRAKNSRKQQTTSTDGTGGRRRGLDIVVAVRKYVSMVEQLFASYSSGSSRSSRDGDGRRRRAHTFTYRRGGGGGSAASSKRHRGRLSSAPASLRGSPANSGHLSVGDSVTKTSSTPSEVSTMEELHSAIQAAIAHCKNSGLATSQSAGAAGGGGDDKQQHAAGA